MQYFPLIDTRLGTYNSHAYSNGNCLPLTSYPWGMNAFCLQTTDQNGAWFFNPYEPIYQGFRLTHQPSPWLGDFATFLVTPVSGPLRRDSLFHRQSSYQLDEAIFRPDLIDIASNRYHIRSQLTPTLYGAQLRCQSLVNDEVSLVFFLPQSAQLTTISSNQVAIVVNNADDKSKEPIAFYASIAFSEPIKAMSQLIDDKQIVGETFSGQDLHIRIDFEASQVDSRLATSYISLEQADYQLYQLKTFEDSLSETQTKWEELLGRVSASDEHPEQTKLFYHCLYRALLFPQTFHEVTENGEIVHLDCHSGKVKQGLFFTNNGYWDTFRTTYPLYSILYPDYYDKFIEGILNHYRNTGYLPKWLSPDERGIMPGTLVDGVLADAACKGLATKHLSLLLDAMLDTAQQVDPNQRYGRHGADTYDTLGYLPFSFNESVSHSLDYAYSDWCIAQVAKALSLDSIATVFEEKSLSYRQLFNTETGYIRAKDEQGNFRPDFSPLAWGRDYAECSAIQATLGALHDIEGTIELLGGIEAFTAYLLKLVNTPPRFECQHYGYEIHEMSEMAQANLGQLAISNQPSFHIPYLFSLSQEPQLTKTLIQKIRSEQFKNDWRAFPGDEDNGSMGAWYIFACLGFYPLCPGKPTYTLTSPAFKQVELHLEDHTFTIIKSDEVKTPLLDDTEIKLLSHAQLFDNHTLTF